MHVAGRALARVRGRPEERTPHPALRATFSHKGKPISGKNSTVSIPNPASVRQVSGIAIFKLFPIFARKAADTSACGPVSLGEAGCGVGDANRQTSADSFRQGQFERAAHGV
jgi:hypothetical protein